MRRKYFSGVWVSLMLLALVSPLMPLQKQAISAGQVKLEVLVPTGKADIKPAKLAKRVDSLDGKRIALHWNAKPGGEYLLAEIEAQLRSRYKNATFYRWPQGTAWKADVEKYIKDQPVDVAILSVGD
jgi:hypothetical protein